MNIELKLLNILIRTENILGFSRQFVTWSIPVKLFVLIRILAEFVLALYTFQCINGINSIIQFILTNSLTFSSVLLSCYYSKTFVKLLEYINSNHMYYNSDDVYRRRLSMLLKLGICALYGYLTTTVGLVLSFIINYNIKEPSDYKILFNRILTNVRFHLELAIQYCLLSIISEQLQCITRSVKKEDTIDYFTTVISRENANSSKKIKIEEWRLLYRNITKSSTLFNKIYGVQIALSFFVFIAFYVSLFYVMVRVGLQGFSTRIDLLRVTALYAHTLFSMILVTMVTRSAQNIQNNASNLTRGLHHLLVRVCSLGDPAQKELSQLLRVVSSRPLHITTFGVVNVNMTLIPACVALIASYTIVALQFNNVV